MTRRAPSRVLLSTQRLALREPKIEDASLLFELDSDPEVMRYISSGAPTPFDRIAQDILPSWVERSERDCRFGYWIAERKASGEFAGWFHLRESRVEPGTMELGYRLRRVFWNQGLATEGGRALLDLAFWEYGLDRVIATTLAANLASRRVMEKLGMECERSFAYPEWPESEAVLYAIRAPCPASGEDPR
jgi:RimJ/RimL family protein N-acetyltransferase